MKSDLISADQLRLHMGEMTPEEVLVAKAAYRLGFHHRMTRQSLRGEFEHWLETDGISILSAHERENLYRAFCAGRAIQPPTDQPASPPKPQAHSEAPAPTLYSAD